MVKIRPPEETFKTRDRTGLTVMKTGSSKRSAGVSKKLRKKVCGEEDAQLRSDGGQLVSREINLNLFPSFTSSKYGLLPFRMRVLLLCPATVTLTTGWMLMPGNWRPSMMRTRTWTGRHARPLERTIYNGLFEKYKYIYI